VARFGRKLFELHLAEVMSTLRCAHCELQLGKHWKRGIL